METSNIIAVVSLLVALLSALYARWAAREARKANLLSVHPSKITIYSAFCALKYAVRRDGTAVKHSDVIAFYRPSREAEFFFSDRDQVEKINKYFDVCFELAEEHIKLSRLGLTEPQIEAIHKRQDLLFETEERLASEVDNAIRGDIRSAIEKPKPIA